MFKFLDYYFIKEFNRMCVLIIIMFFPFIFLADFVISGSFIFKLACSKVLFRYGQMLPLILLITSYLTTTHILYKHDLLMFLQLGCNKIIALKSLCISATFYAFIYYFIIIPSNSVFFQNKLDSKWMPRRIDENKTLFIHKKDNNQYDIFHYDKTSENLYKTQKQNLAFEEDDFYIAWNEVKKLSYQDLNAYEKYLIKHNLDTSEVKKQKIIYFYRLILLFVMVISGYVFALNKSLISLFFVFLISNWIDILAFYLKLKYCILILCLNLIIWAFVSIFALLF